MCCFCLNSGLFTSALPLFYFCFTFVLGSPLLRMTFVSILCCFCFNSMLFLFQFCVVSVSILCRFFSNSVLFLFQFCVVSVSILCCFCFNSVLFLFQFCLVFFYFRFGFIFAQRTVELSTRMIRLLIGLLSLFNDFP